MGSRARIDQAEIPIQSINPSTITASGQVSFQKVTYGPHRPMVRQLILLTGPGEPPALGLDQTVNVVIADGRVRQDGLSIAVGPDVQIVLNGSVGFDGSLALRAGVPLTAGLLGLRQPMDDRAGGTRVELPIGGTLGRRTFDRPAFQVALREAGAFAMLGRAANQGAAGLFQQLDRALGEGDNERSQPGSPLDDLGRGLLRKLIPAPDRTDQNGASSQDSDPWVQFRDKTTWARARPSVVNQGVVGSSITSILRMQTLLPGHAAGMRSVLP